jgi:hypothetical protein
MKPFDICFIDADSLIYRLALKTEISLKLAKTYYDKEIESIQWDTCAEEVKVALKGKGNFRYDVYSDYKGHRKKDEDPNPALTKRRRQLNKYAYSLGHHASDNCEADDVVCIWAQEAKEAGQHYVIAHIDKDINMMEGWHWNPTKSLLYEVTEDEGWHFMCIQMLTGDSTDNIPKKAEKLLTDVAKCDKIDAVRKAWQEAHPEDWKERLEVCWNLIYMRRDWVSFKRLTIEDTLE